MADRVASHYSENLELADVIAQSRQEDKMYLEARRVVKSREILPVYDILQGEGGEVLYPVPWARDPSISHLATPDQMKSLLAVGFKCSRFKTQPKRARAFLKK